MITYNSYTDQELAALLKDGDSSAFTEIYNRFKGPLYIHAFNLLRDREEAKDILQQVFELLWTGRQSLVIKSQLSGYLYTLVRNKIFKTIAHHKVESKYISSLAGFATKGECITDHLVREKLLIEIIEKEISELPERMREIFELSRKSGLSHKEIAAQLNISEKTVRNQVNNALKTLRVKLGLVVYLMLFMNS
ncbi:RNA polymerase sigma-70 factor [Pedobacter heparinus]|uniref:RNA polymerase sigma factor n=1 Tax=Pedobacter heparinus TaxID=984 RepID=UPI002930887A|nr:RNA polymerase sigma-70 factor [Pedobacter heparinus]